MGLDERIELICTYYNLSRTALAKMIGVKPQKLHDIARGQTVRIPSDVLEGMSREFPDIRREWLLTGDGDMISGAENVSSTVTCSGNTVNTVNGNGIKVSANVTGDIFDLANNFSEALRTSQEQLSRAQDQIDRLISVIEKFGVVD